MNDWKFRLAVVFSGVFLFAGAAGAEGIKEGKWAMTTVIQMDGMSGEMAEAQAAMENMSEEEKAMMQGMMGGMTAKMNAGGMEMKSTQCVTNDNPVPEGPEKNCQKTHELRGNTVHFESVCPDSTSSGDVTYTDDTMQGTIHSRQTVEGQEESSTIQITGQFVGPCD